MADLALAVDVGGTKLAAGLVGLDGTLVERASMPTRNDGAVPGADEVLWSDLAGLVSGVVARAGPGDRLVVCGAGCGGPMRAGGEEVSPLNIEAWRGFPLRARLAESTGLATYVDNDAKALALGEGWVGAAAGCADFLAMVVSTGVGGGIVLDGRLLDGRSGNAGHIGHVVVEPSGRACRCGGRGCLEAEASGTAIATVTGRPPREAARRWSLASGRWWGAPSRPWSTCWTCRWRWSADRWRSATGHPSSPRHRRRWIFAAGS